MMDLNFTISLMYIAMAIWFAVAVSGILLIVLIINEKRKAICEKYYDEDII